MSQTNEHDFERDFKQDTRVNKFKLDAECELQSEAFLYWSEQLAEAKRTKDKAQDRLTVLLADIALKYRQTPPAGVKVTEAVISSLVDSDTDIKSARLKLTQARYDVNILEAAVKGMEQKKSM